MRTLLLVLLMIGAVVLEMYLSRKPGRWPGLVLPHSRVSALAALPAEHGESGWQHGGADSAGAARLAAGQHTHRHTAGHLCLRARPRPAYARAGKDEGAGFVSRSGVPLPAAWAAAAQALTVLRKQGAEYRLRALSVLKRVNMPGKEAQSGAQQVLRA